MGSKVFADGEDTHTLRLQASLTRFGGVCELTLATRDKLKSSVPNNKRDQPEGLVGVARYSLMAKILTPCVYKQA